MTRTSPSPFLEDSWLLALLVTRSENCQPSWMTNGERLLPHLSARETRDQFQGNTQGPQPTQNRSPPDRSHINYHRGRPGHQPHLLKHTSPLDMSPAGSPEFPRQLRRRHGASRHQRCFSLPCTPSGNTSRRALEPGGKRGLSKTNLREASPGMEERERLCQCTCNSPQSPQAIQPAAPSRRMEQ